MIIAHLLFIIKIRGENIVVKNYVKIIFFCKDFLQDYTEIVLQIVIRIIN